MGQIHGTFRILARSAIVVIEIEYEFKIGYLSPKKKNTLYDKYCLIFIIIVYYY